MITLLCAKCGQTLTVDDGFAGGVCRCSDCGTIQTVPTREQLAASGGAGPGKAIFQKKSNSELDQLSDVLTSSGLGGSGLGSRSGRGTKPDPEAQARRTRLIWMLAGALVVTVLALAIVVAILLRADGPDVAVTGPSKPTFASIALDGVGPVVFVLDRGDATRSFLPDLRRAVLASMTALGSSRPSQVIFWTDADGESPAAPAGATIMTGVILNQVRQRLDETAAVRSTDALPAIDKALTARPGEIVLVTAKAWQLDDAWADQVINRVRNRGVKVHTVTLADTDDAVAFQRVSRDTGGTHLTLSARQLADLAPGAPTP